MRYTIKALLKSKASILCFIFMLSLNFFTMWELEAKEGNRNNHEAIVQQWEFTAQAQRGFLRNAENQENQMKGDSTLLASYHEYLNMYRYEIDQYDQTLQQMKETSDVRECKKIMQLVDLRNYLYVMNLYADETEGRPYFQEVFQEELEQYQDLLHMEEWPFDTYQFSTYGAISSNGKERYLDAKSKLDYQFKMLAQDNIELTYDQASPWTFLAHQMSRDSMQPMLIGMLAILYTMSWIIMLKDSGAIRLEATRATSIILVLIKQMCCICVSFLLIVFITNLIPILLLGLQHGFQDFNIPVLLYEKGLTSFQTYPRTLDLWETLGLSSFTSTIPVVQPVPYLISEQTSFVGFYMVIAISMCLFVLKVITYCWISLGILFWIKNKWIMIGSGFILISTVWVSQSFQIGANFNPFALSQSMLITEGSSSITWLHAVVLLLCTCLFVLCYQFILSRKKGIE